MKSRKVFALVLAVALVFGSFSVAFAADEVTTIAAPSFTDVSGHWAAAAIDKWSGSGIINGYNGMFRPDDSITRGEMAVIIDNMMNYQVSAVNSFGDLKSGQFYTDAVLKANAAGIIKGDGVNVRPTDKITREEAATMMSRVFSVKAAANTIAFKDAAAVSSWAQGAVYGMEAKGYVQGYNGNFEPKANVTRAATVTMVNNIVKAYYTAAGTYTKNVEGTAVIMASGVILKGNTINGNLIVAEGVAQGDATLDSVTVKGDLVIRGGGVNSVYINGTCSISSIKIEKNGDALRVVISDGNTIQRIDVLAGEEIIITGDVGTLEVASPNAKITLTAADIEDIIVTGANAKIVVGAGSTVATLTATAQVSVSGTGTVESVDLNPGSNGSSITTPNTKIKVAAGVIGVTGGGGTAIPAGSIGTNNAAGTGATITEVVVIGGGGGGGGTVVETPVLTLNSVTITGIPVPTTNIGGVTYYQITKGWTDATPLVSNVTGSKFGNRNYTMVVNATVESGLTLSWERTVPGADMNVTKNITESNLLDNGYGIDVSAIMTQWAKGTVGDKVTVMIGIKNGAVLWTEHFILVN